MGKEPLTNGGKKECRQHALILGILSEILTIDSISLKLLLDVFSFVTILKSGPRIYQCSGEVGM